MGVRQRIGLIAWARSISADVLVTVVLHMLVTQAAEMVWEPRKGC